MFVEFTRAYRGTKFSACGLSDRTAMTEYFIRSDLTILYAVNPAGNATRNRSYGALATIACSTLRVNEHGPKITRPSVIPA